MRAVSPTIQNYHSQGQGGEKARARSPSDGRNETLFSFFHALPQLPWLPAPVFRLEQADSPSLEEQLAFSTMLKGKFALPQKKRVVLDRLGSLIVGLDDDWDSDLGLDSGEELETFRSGGFGSKPEEKDGDEREVCELDDEENLIRESEVRICRRKFAEIPKPVSSSLLTSSRKDVVNKAAELEFELSQKVINLESVQRISNSGLPDGLRATTWKLLLGYLPADRDLWEGELAINRQKYAALKEELLLDPSEFSRRTDTTMASNHQERGDNVDGLLERHEISHGDHPLSMGKASFWHQYFQDAEIAEQIDRDLQRTHPDMRFFSGDPSFGRQNRKAMRNILLLFAKLNPAIRYVQGMNEVLAPLYYVFSTDLDAQNATNAEADSFACFVRLLSDSVDHFCQHLDNSSVGILSTLSRLAELLKVNDEELWRHLAITTKVKPQFYAFRWITLLLTQEFDLHAIMRIWDSLLSNSLGLQEMLLRVCCAMLLCVKRELLKGDFTANLKLLQHYPQIDMEYLLQVAQELRPLLNTHVYM